MFESKSGMLLIGGLGFFAVRVSVERRGADPDVPRPARANGRPSWSNNGNLMYQFEDLSQPLSRAVRRSTIGEPTQGEVRRGAARWAARSTSAKAAGIATASSCGRSRTKSQRWGPVSQTEEYQNELQRPVMFGTRRVGPDLSREGGRRSNDWHAVHFFQPHAGFDRLADARVSLVLRRRARQAQRARPGAHHLRAVARLVARELSVLRRIRTAVASHRQNATRIPSERTVEHRHDQTIVQPPQAAGDARHGAGRAAAQPVRVRHASSSSSSRSFAATSTARSPSARSSTTCWPAGLFAVCSAGPRCTACFATSKSPSNDARQRRPGSTAGALVRGPGEPFDRAGLGARRDHQLQRNRWNDPMNVTDSPPSTSRRPTSSTVSPLHGQPHSLVRAADLAAVLDASRCTTRCNTCFRHCGSS